MKKRIIIDANIPYIRGAFDNVADVEYLVACGGGAHQKYPLRLAMFGPISEKNPGSIMRLHKGICYLSDEVAKAPTTPPDYDILERIAEIKAKEEK